MRLKFFKIVLIFLVSIVTACSHFTENSPDNKPSTDLSNTITDNKQTINNKDIQPPISQKTISDMSVSDLLKKLPNYKSYSYATDPVVFKK